MARSVAEAMAIEFGGARPDSVKKKLPGASIEDSARAAAQKYGIDEKVFLRLIRQESSGDTSAVSPKGAIGLGQLMPDTARELGVDPTKPLENLDGSARYLKQQLDRFGSYDLALAAYNAGPSTVEQAGGVPDIPETQQYVKRIMGDSANVAPKRSVAEAMALEFGAGASGGRTTAVGSGPSYPESPRPYSPPPGQTDTGTGAVEANPIGNPLEAAVGGFATSGLKLPFAVGNRLLESIARNATQNVVAGAVSDVADQRNPVAGILPNAAVGGVVGPVGDVLGQAGGKLLGPMAQRVKAIVQGRLTKRLTEMELESAGRVASPKNVKEIADLVRTSQELGDAATMPRPPATIATEPLGASVGGDRAIPFTGGALRKTMTPILNQHDLALPEDAQRAITGFVGHGPGAVDNPHSTGFGIMDERLLEDAYSATPGPEGAKVREQLDAARQALVSDLRSTYGDEITLYRYQRPVAADAKPRNVLSWTANKNFAEDIAGLKK
jgi:hypothetical protein